MNLFYLYLTICIILSLIFYFIVFTFPYDKIKVIENDDMLCRYKEILERSVDKETITLVRQQYIKRLNYLRESQGVPDFYWKIYWLTNHNL